MSANIKAALFLALASLDALGLAYDTGWSHDENSGYGYAFFSGTTFVDCAHTRVGYRQSADLFSGGYAHAADGSVSSYADMGVLLENDSVAPGHVAEPNKVQLYGQASTRGRPAPLRFADDAGAPQHRVDVVCNTALELTFYVASAREIDVRYRGTFVPKRGGAAFFGTETARIVGFVPADGWSPLCGRCAVRRVETLAVGSGAPTRPGSYFGVASVGGAREAVGRWSGCREGRYAAGRPASIRRTPSGRSPLVAATSSTLRRTEAPYRAVAPRSRSEARARPTSGSRSTNAEPHSYALLGRGWRNPSRACVASQDRTRAV